VVAVGALESLPELDEVAVGPEPVDGAEEDSPPPDEEPELPAEEPELPEDEPELPDEEPLGEEPELLDECEPLELPDDEPEPEPPSGFTYWLSPADAPPPWARVAAGATSASSPSTATQDTNWRHAVIRVSMSSDVPARAPTPHGTRPATMAAGHHFRPKLGFCRIYCMTRMYAPGCDGSC
jgi:hypothetical protein